MKFRVGQVVKWRHKEYYVLERHTIRGRKKYLLAQPITPAGYIVIDKFVAETELEEVA